MESDKIVLSNNKAFSRGVTAAILVFQNKEKAAILVSKTVLWELNSYVKIVFCLSKSIWRVVAWVKTLNKMPCVHGFHCI